MENFPLESEISEITIDMVGNLNIKERERRGDGVITFIRSYDI